jgi:hypothetical protein
MLFCIMESYKFHEKFKFNLMIKENDMIVNIIKALKPLNATTYAFITQIKQIKECNMSLRHNK